MTGGILVLGLRYGRGPKEDRTATELTYIKTREIMDRFAAIHGTFICRKLLNDCNLLSEEGQKQFLANDYLHKICVPCVQSVAGILESIFAGEPAG